MIKEFLNIIKKFLKKFLKGKSKEDDYKWDIGKLKESAQQIKENEKEIVSSIVESSMEPKPVETKFEVKVVPKLKWKELGRAERRRLWRDGWKKYKI